MNREDLIAKRARAYAYAELEKIGSNQTIWFTAPLFDSEDLQTAYLQGAKDADDNPAWRMCKEELPPMRQDVLIAKVDKKTQRISIHISSRHPSDCRYPNEKWIWSGNFLPNNVVAWLPLPKFNQKAEKE